MTSKKKNVLSWILKHVKLHCGKSSDPNKKAVKEKVVYDRKEKIQEALKNIIVGIKFKWKF